LSYALAALLSAAEHVTEERHAAPEVFASDDEGN
jgi:hypothetical protein